MNIQIVEVLLFFSQILGVSKTPNNVENWIIEKNWTREANGYVFEANASNLGGICENNPKLHLILPQVIHGVHEVRVNKKLIYRSGDPTFNKASSFYKHPSISCEYLKDARIIDWKINSYSDYFSRFNSYPKLKPPTFINIFFDEYLNLITAGTMLLLCFFSYYLFIYRISKKIVYCMVFGAIFFGIYFTMCSLDLIGFEISMLNAHKLADFSLFIGSIFYFYVLHFYGYISIRKLKMYILITSVNCCIILLGKSGDIIQFGTSANLPFALLMLINIFFNSLKDCIKSRNNKIAWLSLFSVSIFVITSTSDILHTFGVTNSLMLLPFGAVSSFFLIVLSANEQIEMTYKERDSLLATLENKVNEKTKDLNEALENLKNSQAELVQSAKLASLGTLSAGIAHEINNSINFVNGAIIPLERKVIKHIPEDEKDSIGKLFTVIKQGTDLTVQIVRSLRNFTGLNQSSFREVNVEEITNSVLTILRSKLNGIKLNLNIEKNLTFEGSQVGISQAIMNLLANSIDALPKENPEISILAKSDSEFVEISISDNGSGIPDSVKERIFDPFYTTKEVGKGTGLGLFIVKKEIDKHNGTILVKSEPQKGSTFILKLLKKNKVLETSVNLEAA